LVCEPGRVRLTRATSRPMTSHEETFQDGDSSSIEVSVAHQEKELQDLLAPIIRQQLDLWFDRSHQQFQQTVTQMLEELSSRISAAPDVSDMDVTSTYLTDSTSPPPPSRSAPMLPQLQEDQEAMLRKSESLQPRRKQPEEGWRLSVVPAPSAPRAEAKGRTKSTTLSGSPSLLPHMTDAFDEDLDQVTPKQTRRSKTRAATSASSMRVIDRVSHVSILASPSLTHLSVQEGALEKDIGCRILIGMPCLAYVLTAFFTLLGIIPLIGLHVRGGVFSASYGFLVASNAIYCLVAICCGRLLRTAILSEDLELAFSKLTRFVDQHEIGSEWHRWSRQERWKYAISWLVLNFCFLATWSVDVWICFTTCMDPTPGAGLEEYDMQRWVIFVSAAAVSFLSFAMASGMVLVLAYIHSHLLLGLDRILDCWVADMVETSDFIKGVSSWNSIQALLKSASRELASSFLMLQAFGSLGLMVFLTGSLTFIWRTDVRPVLLAIEGASALPLICLFLIATRLCFHGAALTEKCRNIPALVNQIPGEPVDSSRQYLVRFISDSAAGFILKGVTLTQATFQRQVYVIGTLFSGSLGVLLRIYI